MNDEFAGMPCGPRRRALLQGLLGAALLPAISSAGAAPALAVGFRDKSYVHRWSKAGQHEFTPADDADLERWRDMLTINVHGAVKTGEGLADVANRVLSNYQRAGKVLQTRSTPRTAHQTAEHLIVAVLGQPRFLEAAFARCLMVENRGVVLVASHRVYGQQVGPQMSAWLAANGAAHEQALMAWAQWPVLSSLPSVAA